MIEVRAPLQGTVVRVVAVGELVPAGGEVVVLESMKMEHGVDVADGGVVLAVHVAEGDVVRAGDLLASIDPTASPAGDAAPVPVSEWGHGEPPTDERADLARVRAR
ncbi:MAG TPA: acetyl-CoA carboxylase biotin carboxyl carrier protein subunit, partial [Acidimicrobiales bacterium]|nr:acetyl-CoA carboxylase biotin carboxyl carrier protein subunit [Acidimicrobiales bacterium]